MIDFPVRLPKMNLDGADRLRTQARKHSKMEVEFLQCQCRTLPPTIMYPTKFEMQDNYDSVGIDYASVKWLLYASMLDWIMSHVL